VKLSPAPAPPHWGTIFVKKDLIFLGKLTGSEGRKESAGGWRKTGSGEVAYNKAANVSLKGAHSPRGGRFFLGEGEAKKGLSHRRTTARRDSRVTIYMATKQDSGEGRRWMPCPAPLIASRKDGHAAKPRGGNLGGGGRGGGGGGYRTARSFAALL